MEEVGLTAVLPTVTAVEPGSITVLAVESKAITVALDWEKVPTQIVEKF